MVSIAWKTLSSEDKEDWEEMARRDKARYEMEKTMYTGPWKVPAKKRSQKDPNAPKRPMSAFLSFSNSKRAQVKIKHSDIGNAEVSRILAQMWKDAGEEERKEHIDKEFKLRQTYKVAIAEWRTNSENEMQAARTEREDRAMQAVLAGKSAQDADYYPNDQAAAGPYYGAPDYQTHPPPPPGAHSEAVPPPSQVIWRTLLQVTTLIISTTDMVITLTLALLLLVWILVVGPILKDRITMIGSHRGTMDMDNHTYMVVWCTRTPMVSVIGVKKADISIAQGRRIHLTHLLLSCR